MVGCVDNAVAMATPSVVSPTAPPHRGHTASKAPPYYIIILNYLPAPHHRHPHRCRCRQFLAYLCKYRGGGDGSKKDCEVQCCILIKIPPAVLHHLITITHPTYGCNLFTTIVNSVYARIKRKTYNYKIVRYSHVQSRS